MGNLREIRHHAATQLYPVENLGAGEYVMGLEVSNSFPDGRDKERAQGRYAFIEPGETKKYCFELGIVDGDAEISALKAEIAGYR